ncbi:MAG TPA: hypothetical protein DDX89_06980 [Candidatus Omnitrophica bacterium]|nr:MAG: hypothetical protein A2Z92_02120 [Omnitrophica WOR_2 bacterium GWA2_63_20]OGX16006.1 MAG: hypothetical protein A2105_00030 [Omnitrophica WOR_2 bacterium GWF2_63_9]OGX32005.1 MAG: hypothetical protein A3E56_00745 [Omnitrophica WOR_2 bacterium RIFCSPHIGHO2_12_FULL_64_13]OGX35070.1 MAG: hypothetical protein A3B73_04670 [Omnitrophica WOR_2 bacterium RIFCSPHIGHO2_02_FULL_63_39]OGX45828.1 MAG: hypothetical protein A3I71_05000 [Omnitrophica WOR_2 bacterium RIFCSPLOWO2_02_FULL_63_16]OGX49672.1
MLSVATKRTQAARFAHWRPGLWRFHLPEAGGVWAGVTDRTGSLESLQTAAVFPQGMVMAGQVHGASIASVERIRAPGRPIAGCDALVTQTLGLGLAIRSADCLPLFVWDPVQGVVGMAHAGWRGLAAALPCRLIRFLQQRYHTRPGDLWVGIGPSIRACCYDVGPAFESRLAPWVQEERGRRTCDLIACAAAQLREAGVAAHRVLDSGQCTACEPDRWYSLRREGEACGRLISCIGFRT